jgi:hypothetical protein
MALQNRVTPFGDVVAIPQRGMFIGNRGIIHDPATRTLLKRRWASRAWIVCRCHFKSVRRAVMSGRSWTELFFLDEAVALAGGAPRAWKETGYAVAQSMLRAHTLLTPPSTLAVLEQGYRPVLHPTIAGQLVSI